MTRRAATLAFTLAAVALAAPHAAAQTFERAFGTPAATERANFIAPTASGGYVITGGDSSVNGFNAPYVALVDGLDFIAWQHIYSGPGDRVVHDVLEGPGGSIVCTVGAAETPGFGRGIFKLDSSGLIVWRTLYEGSNILADIKMDRVPGGGYVFTGAYRPAGSGPTLPMLTRVEENGLLLWNRIYAHNVLGNNLNAKLEDVRAVIDRDGKLAFIACGTVSTVGAPNDEGRALVMRLTSDGNVDWAYSFGFADNTLLEAINLDVAPNDDIILACNDLGVGIGDSALMRLDETGNFLWETGYEFFGTGGSMTQLPSGDVIMCGRTRNPAIPGGQAETVLIKTNAAGALQWARAYGGPGFAFGLDATPIPTGFACIGTKITGNPSGTADIQWVRTDANGRTGCETDEPVNQITRNPNRRDEAIVSDTISGPTGLPLSRNPITYVRDEVCAQPPCPLCACDWAPPLGVCDFSDVVAFLTSFGAGADGCACAVAVPVTQCDFSDVVAFLTQFGTNCN